MRRSQCRAASLGARGSGARGALGGPGDPWRAPTQSTDKLFGCYRPVHLKAAGPMVAGSTAGETFSSEIKRHVEFYELDGVGTDRLRPAARASTSDVRHQACESVNAMPPLLKWKR